jgi:tRNA (cytidine/uridine-2'-O-)-methyltransferase
LACESRESPIIPNLPERRAELHGLLARAGVTVNLFAPLKANVQRAAGAKQRIVRGIFSQLLHGRGRGFSVLACQSDGPMQIALYQPDIPQNAGTILRLGACMAVPVHIIEPAGFDASDRTLRRAGLDYLDRAVICRHASFAAFEAWRADKDHRLVLLTTRGESCYTDFRYRAGDVLLLGRESAGAPDDVHAAADARLAIPVAAGLRSLNVAVATAMVLGEALRQTGGFPHRESGEGGKS